MVKKLYLRGKKNNSIRKCCLLKFWDQRWDIKNNNDSVKNILDTHLNLL